MAKHIVSGGGNALNAFLNSSSYKAGDTILVEPGIYSPLKFNKYLGTIPVSSTGGKEDTIIDGGGISCCIKNTYTTPLHIFHFYGFTLRNGYVYSALSSPPLDCAAVYGAVNLHDCNVFDCSAWHDYSPWTTGFGRLAAFGCGNLNQAYAYYRNCEISGCVGLSTNVASLIRAVDCDIHDNAFFGLQSGDKCSFTFNRLIRSKFHHNRSDGICLVGINQQGFNSSLIYSNYSETGNNWLVERGYAKNCIFAKNRNFGVLENSWGGSTKYENCVFVGNELHNLTGQRGTVNTSNTSSVGTRYFNCVADFLSTKFNWNTTTPPSTQVSGNIWGMSETEMGFVDYANDDYRLLPNSPLIGSGVDAYYDSSLSSQAGFTDATSKIDKMGRPFKDPPSIGAYEYYDPKTFSFKFDPFANSLHLSIASGRSKYDAQIECISSTAGQCLDTGLNADSSLGFEIKAAIGAVWGNAIGAFYNQSGAPYLIAFRQGSNAKVQRGTLPSVSGPTAGTTDPHVYYVNTITNVCGVDQVSAIKDTGNFDISGNFYLIGLNRRGNSPALVNSTTYTIYYAKFYENGTLMRDYIPVRIGNKGYLYDKVEEKIYGDQTGRGWFDCGPDI